MFTTKSDVDRVCLRAHRKPHVPMAISGIPVRMTVWQARTFLRCLERFK